MPGMSFRTFRHKKYKKIKKFRFHPENPRFFKKKFKKPKIHRFDLRNPVGWVPHVFLALNQWIGPKNGGSEKVYRKCVKM